MALPEKLEIKAKIQISKTTDIVYRGIVNPDQMSNYFIERGSGALETGKTVKWKWPEFEGEYDIRVKETQPNSFVSFLWDNGDRETLVEIELESSGDATIVSVVEKSMPLDEQGLKWLGGNSEGWANFLASLKAWLEYGINLRKGAFEFHRTS